MTARTATARGAPALTRPVRLPRSAALLALALLGITAPALAGCERDDRSSALAASAPPSAGRDAGGGFTKLSPGLEHRDWRLVLEGGLPPARVHVVRFDPARFALEAVRGSEVDPRDGLAAAPDFRRARGAVAAVNGGYFDPNYKPLGLLVSRGEQLERLRRVDHGVFYIAGGRPGLQHAKRFVAPADLEFAVECGPRLVVDGAPTQLKPSQARRAALGYDAAGRAYVIVSDAVMSLQAFADAIARPVERDGLGLVGALNLDGGSSAMLDLAAGAERAQVPSAIEVPVGLVVVPRAEPLRAGEPPPAAP